ncbi:MAG: hypothetical protein PF508_20865 [Spirochaeta sp.]|nr:hypothetical protein [Spirochaeta sp.]
MNRIRWTHVLHGGLLAVWIAFSIWTHGILATAIVAFGIGVLVVGGFRLDAIALLRFFTAAAIAWVGAAWLTVGNSVLIGAACLGAGAFIGYKAFRDPPDGEPADQPFLLSFLRDPNSLVVWVVLFVVSIYGFHTSEGVYLLDATHPTYEASIGNSFSRSVLSPPDLSLPGKTIRFHFLSTQLTRSVAALGIPPLTAIYYVAPSILGFLAVIVFGVLFRIEGIARYSALLFFVPVLVLVEDTIGTETLFRRSIMMTPSFTLGMVFVVAFFVEVRRSGNRVVALILSLAVLFTKATFFPVILGGMILRWFFVERREKDHAMLPLIGAMTVAFLVAYALFYSGAHSHNHWVVGPGFLYRLVIDRDIFHALFFVGILIVIAYRIRNKLLEPADWFVMSGVLGTLLVAEITEYGSYQFLTAASPFLLVVATKTITPRMFRPVRIAMVIAVVGWTIVDFRPYGHAAIQKFVADLPIDSGRIAAFDSPPTVSNEMIAAYSYLSSQRDDSIVFFSPVYELETEYAGTRFSPDTGFIRSAVSDRQLYRENFKYKGLPMDPRYITHLANSLRWYDEYFEHAPETQRIFGLLLTSSAGYERGEPFGPTGPLDRVLIYYAGLGTEWSWFNQRYLVLHDAMEAYNRPRDTTEAIDPTIGVIVTERGDTFIPPEDETWEQVWIDGPVSIWHRGDDL